MDILSIVMMRKHSPFFQSLFDNQAFDFEHLIVWLRDHIEKMP